MCLVLCFLRRSAYPQGIDLYCSRSNSRKTDSRKLTEATTSRTDHSRFSEAWQTYGEMNRRLWIGEEEL